MSLKRPLAVLIDVIVGFSLGGVVPCTAQELGTYSVPDNKIFVAGISSGGYMAVQMHVAFSGTFKGAAVYAGGPYYCAQDSLEIALTTCLDDVPPVPLSTLVSATVAWSKEGLIDPVSNLRGQPVYLWSGALDTTVVQAVMNTLHAYYRYFGANVFQYDNNFNAEHGWESPNAPLTCQENASPFIVKCVNADRNPPLGGVPLTAVYDSEQVWLTRWFGPLKPKNQGTLTGTVIAFDQNEFATGGNAAALSMDNTGYAFVPAACASGMSCGLILALHGCLQYHGQIGPAFVDDAGINQWADTNRFIVLYPQAIATAVTNGEGCWDWWGYLNDPNYAQKSGPQMQALYSMVARTAGLNKR
jgi:poly(3-hydroxybutyrate) depolymerase